MIPTYPTRLSLALAWVFRRTRTLREAASDALCIVHYEELEEDEAKTETQVEHGWGMEPDFP